MKKYGPGSEIFEAARVREEKGDKTYPIQGSWTNGTVKFLVKAATNNESSTGWLGWTVLFCEMCTSSGVCVGICICVNICVVLVCTYIHV